MSGGLYSMEEKDYDKNLNLKAIKPYGDTMNEGAYSGLHVLQLLRFGHSDSGFHGHSCA